MTYTSSFLFSYTRISILWTARIDYITDVQTRALHRLFFGGIPAMGKRQVYAASVEPDTILNSFIAVRHVAKCAKCVRDVFILYDVKRF